MKNARKLICLLLALLLTVGILAGCGGDNSPGTTPTDQAPAPTATPGAPQETERPALPISDDVVEYTCWMVSFMLSSNMLNFSENVAYQGAEKVTNIRLKFQHPAAASAVEVFNLMFSSGTITDLIVVGDSYLTGGFAKYVDDGFFFDMTSYADEYAPNYQSLRLSNEEIFKGTMDDGGMLTGFMAATTKIQNAFLGHTMRKDWLDKTGLAEPITYDEWHTVLTALKDYTSVAPLHFAISGINAYFTSGFGLGEAFIQRDGVVTFSPIEDGFKQYLTMMNQWYSEGLIDPDFYTRGMFYQDIGSYANGFWAVSITLYTMVDMIEGMGKPADENFELMPVLPPKINANDTRKIDAARDGNDYVPGQFGVISTNCATPELAMRYFDFFFTDQGYLLANYGIEGETYEIVDGKPQYLEIVYKNPDDLSLSDAILTYSYGAYWPRVYAFERELIGISQRGQDMAAYWQSDYDMPHSYIMSDNLALTEEESRIYSAAYADIQTLLNESVVQFITGQKGMDEWDGVVDQIKTMGIRKCIDVYQAALDRYNNRGK
jgi:putative aldouronate transport system substrate-binding protein